MKRLDQEGLSQEAQYLRMLVYGEAGSGKTWFCASGALDELTAPVLFLAYRGQVSSVRSNPLFMEALDDGRLVILELEKYKELSYVYSWLERGRGSNENFDELFPDEMPKTIAVDSLTELQRSEVMRRAGNPPGKFLTEIEPPQIQHWGSLLNQFTLLAHLFYNLPYHVVFTGLESVDYGKAPVGEMPPITGYRVALQGQAKRQFPAYALVVMRLERAAPNVKAFCRGLTRGRRSKTKEQTSVLPPKVFDPTIPMFAKLLQEVS